jgi:ABC-type amino acid transport substrate-binding protein
MCKIITLGLLIFFSPQMYSATLKIGTPPQNPPFADLVDNENIFYGLDIDLMMQVCKRLNVTCVFQPIIYKKLFAAVLDHQIDLAIGAIIVTSEKSNDFVFSLPYLESKGRFIALKESKINSVDQISQGTVGIRKGTAFKYFIATQYKTVKIKEFDSVADLLEALSDEEIDVICINDAAANYWVVNSNNSYKEVGPSMVVGDGYSIMARRGNHALVDQINKALLDMSSDGTTLQIYSRYFNL